MPIWGEGLRVLLKRQLLPAVSTGRGQLLRSRSENGADLPWHEFIIAIAEIFGFGFLP